MRTSESGNSTCRPRKRSPMNPPQCPQACGTGHRPNRSTASVQTNQAARAGLRGCPATACSVVRIVETGRGVFWLGRDCSVLFFRATLSGVSPRMHGQRLCSAWLIGPQPRSLRDSSSARTGGPLRCAVETRALSLEDVREPSSNHQRALRPRGSRYLFCQGPLAKALMFVGHLSRQA